MSGRGKGGKVKGKAKSRSTVLVCSSRSAVSTVCSARHYAERVGAGAPVYLAAVMEYLAAATTTIKKEFDRRKNSPKNKPNTAVLL
ncbi:histone H2A [Culex quinquefasciatus]|uniref:Histone H2A n=1 Tax=Culex quinquefasciatus TaxID=7176 RepID=B0WZ69_CULQU|nr:histone H2A [Culex quinquefasciatus]|eukprot:XP_001862691.1 histone H2A [Culex quinquefasciatus]